jgi:hypothetical protein
MRVIFTRLRVEFFRWFCDLASNLILCKISITKVERTLNLDLNEMHY